MNSTVSVVYYIILLIITELIKILIKSSLYFQLSLYFLQSFFSYLIKTVQKYVTPNYSHLVLLL